MGIWFPAFVGWTLGSVTGAAFSSILPHQVADAMNIALYAMFIAIIIPPARKNRAIALVIIVAILLECILHFTPVLKNISVGFQVIIAAVIAAIVGAIVKPIKAEE